MIVINWFLTEKIKYLVEKQCNAIKPHILTFLINQFAKQLLCQILFNIIWYTQVIISIANISTIR